MIGHWFLNLENERIKDDLHLQYFVSMNGISLLIMKIELTTITKEAQNFHSVKSPHPSPSGGPIGLSFNCSSTQGTHISKSDSEGLQGNDVLMCTPGIKTL